MNRSGRRFALRALLSGGLFALLLSRVHWAELAALLRGVRPVPLVLGALLIAVCPLLIAARTRLLLGQWGIAMRYRTVLALTWLGQFCNTFLPGSTGGDAVKFYRVCRLVPDRKTAGLAALLADRLVALLALLLLAGGALVFGDHQLMWKIVAGSSGRIGAREGMAALALLAAGALALAWLWRRFGERTGALMARVREMAASLRAGLHPSPALGIALLLALTVHLLALGSCYQFCRALQIPASFGQVMLVWPVTMLAVLLPLTVNGHGLREYVLLFYFGRWQLVSALSGGSRMTETVLALSLLMVATDFFWSLPGGLCLLAGNRPHSRFPGRAGVSPKTSGGDGRAVCADVPGKMPALPGETC
jgi:uncharacterized membrane protein YbhN (UPF0104 family)